MEEEVIDYLYNWATSDGFKKSKEDFVKLLQTNDEVLSYAFDFAQKDGFKKDKNALGLLVGRTATSAPVATTEPAKTETVTEPAKELRSEPMATVKAQALPEKQVATPTVDMEKMPTMEVKSVEATPTKEEPMTAEKKEAVKSDIESQLLPVTEKTEVKAIETPSDKMVIKSDQPKVEVKPAEVAKVEVKPVEEVKSTAAETIEGRGLWKDEDLTGIKLPKYKPEEIIDKKLLTENKEALGLKQFEDRDLIFKKWLKSKGMPLDTKEENLNSIDRPEYDKYLYNQENNRTRAIVDSYLPYLMENKDKLSSEYQEKLKEELTSPTFKVFVQGFRGDFYKYDKNNPNFKLIEKVNEEYWRDPAIYDHVKKQYGIQDGEKQKMNANEFLQSPILKNSEKVITKFGPMFYDKENDTYYKYEYGILNAEPYIKYQQKQNPDYQVPLEVIKPGTEQHNLIKEGDKETWDGVDRTMYRGTSVKKDGAIQVKEVPAPSDKMVIKSDAKVEQPKVEVKPTEVAKAKVEVKEMKAEEPKMKVMTKEEKKEWQCPPSEGGCPKNKDVVHNYFDEKYKDKDYTPIIDREGNLAKFIDDGARGVPITEYYGRKSYTHDSYGFTYSAEELPKSERFSVYNVPIKGKETSLIYDNKTGVIMKDTGDIIKTEDGKQMITWLDVPMNNPEYTKLKEDIEKIKAGKGTYVAPTTETQFVPDWLKK